MQHLLYNFSAALLFFVFPAQTISFEHKNDNVFFLKGSIITLTHDNKEIGFIHYVKLPLFRWCVIHSFFIKKEYRKMGYGKQLFQKALDTLTLKKASKIFVQPGAFEVDVNLSAEEKKERMSYLVRFYEQFGFKINQSKYFYKFLNRAYKMSNLHEDAKVFMVKQQNGYKTCKKKL